jgi:hypothetical protein
VFRFMKRSPTQSFFDLVHGQESWIEIEIISGTTVQEVKDQVLIYAEKHPGKYKIESVMNGKTIFSIET